MIDSHEGILPLSEELPSSSYAQTKISRRRAIGMGLGVAALIGASVVLNRSPVAQADTVASFQRTSTSTTVQQSSLQQLIAFNTANYNSEVGLIPNPGRGILPNLGWTYLDGIASPLTTQVYNFEPNENWKIAAYLVDSSDPTLAQMGSTILQTLTGLNALCHYHSPWKDEALLGFPTPYGNENVNPGFSFTPSYGPPLMTLSDGTPYQILQAAAVQASGSPPVWRQPNLNPRSGTTVNVSSFDEGLFQVANRFIRGDNVTATSLFDQATRMWDGVGFAGSSGQYRGMYLGIYLYVNKLIGANSPIASAVEAKAWSLQQSNGGIARLYSGSGPIYGSDNETSNALLLSYADGWIARVQAVAASGKYDLSTVPAPSPSTIFP